MIFVKGQYIKPEKVALDGTVEFINANGDRSKANKASCEAYGYKWDKVSNSCRAYPRSRFNLVSKIALNVGNKTSGPRNEVKEGSFYNDINGADNIIGTQVQNSTVSGRGNEIIDNIHNASVSGSNAKVQRQSEIALGGGNFGEDVSLNGYSQSSAIHCTARTSGAGTFIAGVAGISTNTIPLQTHTLYIFDFKGVCVKEAGGAYWNFYARWAVQTNNDGEATFCNADSGTQCGVIPEGWTMPEFLQLGGGEDPWGDLQLNVVGLAEVDLMYNIKVDILETRNLTNY
jgi:hypothetical protein